jgi:hypothetical protein
MKQQVFTYVGDDKKNLHDIEIVQRLLTDEGVGSGLVWFGTTAPVLVLNV